MSETRNVTFDSPEVVALRKELDEALRMAEDALVSPTAKAWFEAARIAEAECTRLREALPDGAVVVTIDSLDGGYVAEVIGRPGCLSPGDTVPEALHNVADALAALNEGGPE